MKDKSQFRYSTDFTKSGIPRPLAVNLAELMQDKVRGAIRVGAILYHNKPLGEGMQQFAKGYAELAKCFDSDGDSLDFVHGFIVTE